MTLLYSGNMVKYFQTVVHVRICNSLILSYLMENDFGSGS